MGFIWVTCTRQTDGNGGHIAVKSELRGQIQTSFEFSARLQTLLKRHSERGTHRGLRSALRRRSHGKVNACDCVFPSQRQLPLSRGGFGESNFVSFYGFGRTAQLHRHAPQITVLMVLETRLSSLLVEDQLPLV